MNNSLYFHYYRSPHYKSLIAAQDVIAILVCLSSSSLCFVLKYSVALISALKRILPRANPSPTPQDLPLPERTIDGGRTSVFNVLSDESRFIY